MTHAAVPLFEFSWELLLASAPFALLVGWVWTRRGQLCETLVVVRERHAGLIASALRMHEASGLIPLLGGPGPLVRKLNRRFYDAVEEANRLSAALDQVDHDLRYWHVGRAQRHLGRLVERVAAFEADVAELEAAMRGLNDDAHECARYMGVVRGLHAEISALLGRQEGGWDEDVREALAAIARQLDEAERRRDAGEPVDALCLTRGLQGALLEQKRVLEARQASMTWLKTVPAEARRLEGEERRLRHAGFRDLPRVDVGALGGRAEAAIAALRHGRLASAAEAQRALRHDMRAMRDGLIGREELYWANRRNLAALETEARAIGAQLDAIHEGDCRTRYPRRLWDGACRLRQELTAEAATVTAHLEAAAIANTMEAQDFQRARERLRLARDLNRELREAVGRCQAMWQALPRRERQLKDRMLTLLGEAADAKAAARQLGLAIDPGLMAMLEALRQGMEARPLDLEEAERTLKAAEGTLERFRERLASLAARLERVPRWGRRPASVTLVRVENAFEAEEGQRRRR